jgi:hypothetical protein
MFVNPPLQNDSAFLLSLIMHNVNLTQKLARQVPPAATAELATNLVINVRKSFIKVPFISVQLSPHINSLGRF